MAHSCPIPPPTESCQQATGQIRLPQSISCHIFTGRWELPTAVAKPCTLFFSGSQKLGHTRSSWHQPQNPSHSRENLPGGPCYSGFDDMVGPGKVSPVHQGDVGWTALRRGWLMPRQGERGAARFFLCFCL